MIPNSYSDGERRKRRGGRGPCSSKLRACIAVKRSLGRGSMSGPDDPTDGRSPAHDRAASDYEQQRCGLGTSNSRTTDSACVKSGGGSVRLFADAALNVGACRLATASAAVLIDTR